MSITAETKAFQDIILQANRAHKAYNEKGKDVGIYALAGLAEMVQTMIHHLHNKPTDNN
ncbi:MAG: hypothetical protein JRC86_05455 [Deltaproteobacteria bacterium]|nr:hypothetical protein [Deltaproteobacteria bacterium]